MYINQSDLDAYFENDVINVVSVWLLKQYHQMTNKEVIGISKKKLEKIENGLKRLSLKKMYYLLSVYEVSLEVHERNVKNYLTDIDKYITMVEDRRRANNYAGNDLENNYYDDALHFLNSRLSKPKIELN